MTPPTDRQKVRMLGWSALLVLVGAEALLTGWALLALLGFVPSPTTATGQSLATPDLASMAVAGGTLILATVTVVLALLTRRSLALGSAELKLAEDSVTAVKEQTTKVAEQVTATQAQVAAAQEQAQIARQTLEASWRPFLVDVPWGYATRGSAMGGSGDAAVMDVWKNDNGSVEADVPLRNIGSGPAIITRAGLSVTQLHWPAARFSTSIVAPGEVVRIRFEVAPGDATRNGITDALLNLRPFVVTVFYADQGTGKWRSRVYVHKSPERGAMYEVDYVELYAGDENIPFATGVGT
jgi:hypothetical protein